MTEVNKEASVGKPKGRRPLGIFRHRRKGNIKIDCTEIVCESVE
jgi:hypothetical protein